VIKKTERFNEVFVVFFLCSRCRRIGQKYHRQTDEVSRLSFDVILVCVSQCVLMNVVDSTTAVVTSPDGYLKEVDET
jgi:hypothetical protein